MKRLQPTKLPVTNCCGDSGSNKATLSLSPMILNPEHLKHLIPIPDRTIEHHLQITNQNSLFRSRDWLSANQGAVFPDSVAETMCVLVRAPHSGKSHNLLRKTTFTQKCNRKQKTKFKRVPIFVSTTDFIEGTTMTPSASNGCNCGSVWRLVFRADVTQSYPNYGYNRFVFTSCNDGSNGKCDLAFDNFTITVDGEVKTEEARVLLPDNDNDVTLTSVSFFSETFSYHFQSDGEFFISADITERNQGGTDTPYGSIAFPGHFHDKDVNNGWLFRNHNNGQSWRIYFDFRISACDFQFTGDGCADCGDLWIGTNCEECKNANREIPNCDSCIQAWTGENCDSCALRWTGENCDTCALGWAGENCDTCALGWTGDNCDNCAPNFYPMGNCSVECIGEVGRSSCDESGTLICEPDSQFTGVNCSSCMDNYFGSAILPTVRKLENSSAMTIGILGFVVLIRKTTPFFKVVEGEQMDNIMIESPVFIGQSSDDIGLTEPEDPYMVMENRVLSGSTLEQALGVFGSTKTIKNAKLSENPYPGKHGEFPKENIEHEYAESDLTKDPEPLYAEPDLIKDPEPLYAEPDLIKDPEPLYAEPDLITDPEPLYEEPDLNKDLEPLYEEPDLNKDPEPLYADNEIMRDTTHIYTQAVYCGGTFEIRYNRFQFTSCTDGSNGQCDLAFDNFKMTVDGKVKTEEARLLLPDNENDVPLNNVSFFSEPFSYHFKSDGVFLVSADVTERNEWGTNTSYGSIEFGGHFYNKNVSNGWFIRVHINGQNWTIYFDFRISACDIQFTGDGCADCGGLWTGTNCEECKNPNRETPNCESCIQGWTGEDCDSCALGWAGNNCDTCALGWTGNKCDSCALGWSGNNCDTCALGWEGNNCDTCALGWAGSTCDTCALGWTGNKCDTCALGWTGNSCDTCALGWAGENCDTCALVWTGDNCDNCAPNFYPMGDCSVECIGEVGRSSCDESGTLICEPDSQFTGVNCSSCTDNYFGSECDIHCAPTNTSYCSEMGELICHDNWYGPDCNKFCISNENFTCDEHGDMTCADESTYYGCTCIFQQQEAVLTSTESQKIVTTIVATSIVTTTIILGILGLVVLIRKTSPFFKVVVGGEQMDNFTIESPMFIGQSSDDIGLTEPEDPYMVMENRVLSGSTLEQALGVFGSTKTIKNAKLSENPYPGKHGEFPKENIEHEYAESDLIKDPEPLYAEPDLIKDPEPLYAEPDLITDPEPLYAEPDLIKDPEPLYAEPDLNKDPEPLYEEPDLNKDPETLYEEPDLNKDPEPLYADNEILRDTAHIYAKVHSDWLFTCVGRFLLFTVEVHLKSDIIGLWSPTATMDLTVNVIWRSITSQLLWMANVSFFSETFSYHFKSDGVFFISADITERNEGGTNTSYGSIAFGGHLHFKAGGWFIRYHNNGQGCTIYFQFRISACDFQFTGDGCAHCGDLWNGTNCEECKNANRETPNCDSCIQGWTGENCDTCALGWAGNNCDTCALGWAGAACDSCALNIYPIGDCSVECIGEVGRSSCDESGTLICEPNSQFTGVNCSSCMDNYFGSECDIHCAPSNTSDCSETGEIICYDNWYGPDCNNFCISNENFTCDEQGKMTCAKDSKHCTTLEGHDYFYVLVVGWVFAVGFGIALVLQGIVTRKEITSLKTQIQDRREISPRCDETVEFRVVAPNTEHEMETSEQPIRTCYLGHVTGYQPIRGKYLLIRLLLHVQSDPDLGTPSGQRLLSTKSGYPKIGVRLYCSDRDARGKEFCPVNRGAWYIGKIYCGGGTLEFDFIRFKFTDCSDAGGGCDLTFENFKIKIDGEVVAQDDWIELPDNTNNVYLPYVGYFANILSFHFEADADFSISADIIERDSGSPDDFYGSILFNGHLDSKTRDHGWYYRDHQNSQSWTLYFYFRISSCDLHFTGNGCAECENRRTGTNCDSCIQGWAGDNCDTCALGWAGENCETCALGWAGDNCDTCSLGWAGDNCDTCALGWAGDGCANCGHLWTGTNCDQCKITNRQEPNCNSCVERWDGENCDRCAPNFYPMGDCSVECIGELGRSFCDESGTLNCDSDSHFTGPNCENCEENWVGEACNICTENFFGSECDTFCAPTNTSDCSESGEIFCNDNWYGPDCNKFCISNENFTCNEHGEMTCEKGSKDLECVQKSEKSKTTAVIGGSIGGVVIFVIILGIGIFFVFKKLKQARRQEKDDHGLVTFYNPTNTRGPVNRNQNTGYSTEVMLNGPIKQKESATQGVNDVSYSTLHSAQSKGGPGRDVVIEPIYTDSVDKASPAKSLEPLYSEPDHTKDPEPLYADNEILGDAGDIYAQVEFLGDSGRLHTEFTTEEGKETVYASISNC
eukprot:sb/3460496/